MKQNGFLALWGGMFILCAGLGFIPEPTGFLRWMMTGLSLLFFLPPFLLLGSGDRERVKLVRNLSGISLLITLVLIIANFAAFSAPETLGAALYVLLVILSSPMVCSGYWVLSLFLWACLLMASLKKLKIKN